MHRCRPLVYVHAYIVCVYLCRCVYMCMYACSYARELRVRRWRKIWRRVKRVSYSLPTQSQPTSLYRKKMLLAISLVVKSVHNKDLKRGWGLGDCQQGTTGWRERGGYRQIVINASHRWSIGDWTKSKFASCPCQLPYKTPLSGVPWVTLPIKSRPYH